MICLRCGYCCHNYMVIIVDDPDKGISEGNLIAHMGEDTPCKHLGGDKPGEYFCKIHDKKWYDQTPCFSHGQIERGNTECRMGKYILGEKNGCRQTSRKI